MRYMKQELLSTLNIPISPVYVPQRHFPNESQAPLKPSTLFGFLTCSNPSRLDHFSITNLLIFCLFVSICSAAKTHIGFFMSLFSKETRS